MLHKNIEAHMGYVSLEF